MGRATIYCDACGGMISAADQDSGKAVSVGSHAWCRQCAPEHAPKEQPAVDPRKGRNTGPFRAVTTDAGTARKTPKTGAHRPVQPDSDVMKNLQSLQAGAPGRPGAPPGAAKSQTPLIAAGVVALVAILGLAFFLMGGDKEGGSSASSTKDEDGARKAWERAKAAKGTMPAKAWAELVRAAKKDAAGTKYADDLEALHKEALAAADKEERSEALRSALDDAIARAGGAEDPLTMLPLLEDVRKRASTEAPDLLPQVDAAVAKIRRSAQFRRLDKVDTGWAVTPVGRTRILEELEAILAEPGTDASVKDAVAKKRVSVDEQFGKAAETAVEDLRKRIERMRQESRWDEADAEVRKFGTDWAGTPAMAKLEEIRKELAAAREKLVGDWIELSDKDWETDAPGLKVEARGREVTMTSDSAEDGAKDSTLKVGYALKDTGWKNFELELDVKVDRVGGALQVHPVAGGRPFTVRWLEKRGDVKVGVDAGRWYRVRVRVEGLQLTLSGDVKGGTYPIHEGTGGFAVLTYRGAKVGARNARIRKLK
ncbi:MAG: hypothetical protein HYY18_16780 [Planctomycetes bacterium]|nr:hypothetical protein [Planctomycetota bacterium]